MFSKITGFCFLFAGSTLALANGNPKILSGGQGTVFANGINSFSLPMKNITREHRRVFFSGRALFNENWVTTPSSVKSREGLGPLHNAQSCSSCHAKDGRGAPPVSEKEAILALLIRMSIPGEDQTGGPLPVSNYGDQFQQNSILGVPPEGEVVITFEDIHGKFKDGSKYILKKPTYLLTKLNYGPLPRNLLMSPRIASPVYGVGLVEAIAAKDILKLEDVDDKNIDGISGRANFVWSEDLKRKALGRFGWKANQPSTRQQNAGAFAGDIGITSPLFANSNCTSAQKVCAEAPGSAHPEITEETLREITIYTNTLAVPARRQIDDPVVVKGEKVFKDLSCHGCHVESFVTGIDKDFPENSSQTIFPYSDFLLHDMGDDLSDGRPDFLASGSEWRTPPLWGIGLTEKVNKHTRFLHDGRARNLEEAVLWHGGEAEVSKNKYLALPRDERHSLIEFLKSL